jgi:formylglycine-generating enzyme required for sulfatase activity
MITCAGCHGAGIPSETLDFHLGDDQSLALVRVPAGAFIMGSPDDEPGRDPDELAHRVTITRAFYMGIHEVTQSQWQRVMPDNPSFFDDDPRRPVDSVTWEMAEAFCRRLSARVGRTVRLPTEAEWEYACRAGTTTPFSFGDDLLPYEANYDWTHDGANPGDFPHQTMHVASFPANAWGLYDMHGNVREWCVDWYASDTYKRAPNVDPNGPDTGAIHVLRGGGWEDYDRRCRSAYRHGYKPGDRDSCIGFRVCVEIEK